MPAKVVTPTRVFRYNSIDYPDPAPGLPVERAVELLSTSVPALTNAVPDPGKPEAGKIIYTLKASVGTKG